MRHIKRIGTVVADNFKAMAHGHRVGTALDNGQITADEARYLMTDVPTPSARIVRVDLPLQPAAPQKQSVA